MAMPRSNENVTLHGCPVNLVGGPVRLGRPAPDFTVLDADLKDVTLSDFAGKPCILSSVVSLDTPVCDLQMRRFNQEASALGPDVQIIVISMDLPFAQKRWCGAAGADNVHAFSDHRDASFGKAFGLLIQELRLLARAVMVIDADGILRYRQVVPEVTQEPDYAPVLDAVRKFI